MVASTEPRRDVITTTGAILAVAGALVAAVVVARIILVQGEWGTGTSGALHTLRHVGYVITTPFHHVFHHRQIHDIKARELVNDAIAAAVYALSGLILRRLLS